MTMKLGTNDITLKVGDINVDAAYLGTVLVYSGGTPPSSSGNVITYEASDQIYFNEFAIQDEFGNPLNVDSHTFDDGQGIIIFNGDIAVIGDYAFNSCSDLISITIPNSVTTIGDGAFFNCSSLTSIDIPSGVTSIGEMAFTFCRSLTSITVEATTPPTLGHGAFEDTNDCPIYVPSVEDYIHSDPEWGLYGSRLQAIPT